MKMRLHWKKLLALALAAALLTAAAPGALAWERRGEYQERFALATDGTRWGYVNGAGSLVIPLRYSAAEPFYLGIARVELNGKAGILRQDGSYLIPPVYDALEDLGYGLYAGKRGGTWSLLCLNELPESSRVEGGDSRALYTGASSIGWEEREVLVTQEPVGGIDLPTAEPSAEPTATPPAEGTASPAPQPTPSYPPLVLPTFPPVTEVRNELVLRWPDGELLRLEEDALLQLMRERGVPGWSFPLDSGRKTSFGDVRGRDWFSPWVNIVNNVGLMEGRDGLNFQPWQNLKVCEAVKLVALMDCQGAGRPAPSIVRGRIWYERYLDYCVEHGILGEQEFDDYERAITRAELALLISRTSLYADSADINDRETIRRSIPDVGMGDYAAEAIFGLYAKGVLTGYSNALNFQPNASIVRAEVAAMVARMVRPEQRVSLNLGGAATPRAMSLETPEEE